MRAARIPTLQMGRPWGSESAGDRHLCVADRFLTGDTHVPHDSAGARQTWQDLHTRNVAWQPAGSPL